MRTKFFLLGAVWHEDSYVATKDADLLVILTEWNDFRALDLERLAGVMAIPCMADLRNINTPGSAADAGFETYSGVGRRPATKYQALLGVSAFTSHSCCRKKGLPFTALTNYFDVTLKQRRYKMLLQKPNFAVTEGALEGD